MSEAASAREKWEFHARKVALKVNLGWWMQGFSGPLLLTSLLGTVALLLIRREYPLMPLWQSFAGISAVVLIVALMTWVWTRRYFEKPEQSMVRMEASMNLCSGLSAARAGVGPWPAAPDRVDAGLRWNWQRVLIAPLAALLLLLAGNFIPIGKLITASTTPDEPLARKAIESSLDQLEAEKVVDQEYIEEVRKKIEELRAQDPDQWFSHAAMEATDHLQKEHKAETQRLQRDFSQAAKALGNLEKNPQMNEKEKARLANEFEQALDGMKNGAMKPNPALLEQLKQLTPENLGKLTPEQMNQLKKNLQENAEKMKDAGQEGEGAGDDWSDELLADGTHPNDQKKGKGQGQGEGEGEDGESEDGPGKGGVSRGPGHDPNLLGQSSQQLETGKNEGLQSQDLSKTIPGDLLELQDGRHEVDKNATGSAQGGDVSETGKGGDRVWRESLDPHEQKALKKFFE